MGVVVLLALVLGAAALPADAQQPPWQKEMDQARRSAAAGNEDITILTFPGPESARSGVYVFYNDPRPFCYTYMIPGEWVPRRRERAYYSKDGRRFAGVLFWLARNLEGEDGATLVERAGSRITKAHRKQYGDALAGVEFVPFESSRSGIWQWRAAPITKGESRINFPAKLVVDLSPDAVAQITVVGTSDDEQLALARQILESLRTTKDPECFFPVLESMHKARYENR